MPKSILIPLRKSITDGYFYGTQRNSEEGIYINLYQLFMTIPGERVMLPYFGIGLKKYLFGIQDNITIQTLRNNIIEQIKKYLPYLNLLSVYIAYSPITANSSNNDVKMIIIVMVENAETKEPQNFLFSFSINNLV